VKNPKSGRLVLALLIGALLLSLTGTSDALKDANSRLAALALNAAGFRSTDLPLSAGEEQVYRNIHVLKKLCIWQGEQAQLVCLDGTRDRHAVHDPRLCFRSAQWEVLSETVVPHPAGGEMRRLRLRRDKREVETVYWWSTATERHASALKYFMQSSLRRLTRGCSGEEPVLVVLQPVQAGQLDWNAWLSPQSPLHSL
jgi:hypothetical protein